MMNKYENDLVCNFRQLGCPGLAERLGDIFSSRHVKGDDLLKVLANTTEEEYLRLKQLKGERLLKLAGLLNTYANLDIIEYLPERALDATLIERLASCAYINEGANVVITGAAGTGKTFIARALGVQACKEGYRTRIVSLRGMLKDLSERDLAGEDLYARKIRMLSRIPLLIIDEWFAHTLNKSELVMLHELIDARYGRRSTIICSQMPPDNWPAYCPNRALGESITGRILSKCYSLELEGEDLRKIHSERP